MPPFLVSQLVVTSSLLSSLKLSFILNDVVGTTLDGYSANRRFIQLVVAGATGVKHKMANPFAPDCEIFFFSDPPHLLKTVRNCLANPRRTFQVLAYINH